MKRYVMANRPDGLSDVVDETDLSAKLAAPGLQSQELWRNDETPADLSDPADPVADQAMYHEPPDGGAIFRVLKFPPAREMPEVTPEMMVAYHQAIHSVHVPSLEYLRSAKSPTMHKTDTLNYFVLASGELWALSEGRDVLLRPGDVVVQKGCMHGWANRSDEPAVLVAVLIDSHPA
ncbi:MAG: cupin domain-containing protein [Deltaproteobacteria bacterium]|nr:cupin domain-containing protein [Deltaproteobacteria bacterium]